MISVTLSLADEIDEMDDVVEANEESSLYLSMFGSYIGGGEDAEEGSGLTGLKTTDQGRPTDSQKDKKQIAASLDDIVKLIKEGKCKNIVTMAGAGMSTSAGIPDFRSRGSGLYDNLKKYNLPFPEAIFTLPYFKYKPQAFFTLAKELLPFRYKPTPCHYLLKLLNEKGILLRHYTQNIDTLEKEAGLPDDKIIEAHGTFKTSHCLTCKKEYSLKWMEEQIFQGKVPRCTEPSCNGIVKPDIVFFGEKLPKSYFDSYNKDLPAADLLIVIGTSLHVHPFASLVNKVKKDCPRLLINREKVGEAKGLMKILGMGGGLDFDSSSNTRDVAWLGDCDEGCQLLADKLGWGDELRAMVEAGHKKFDEENGNEKSEKKSPQGENKQEGEEKTVVNQNTNQPIQTKPKLQTKPKPQTKPIPKSKPIPKTTPKLKTKPSQPNSQGNQKFMSLQT